MPRAREQEVHRERQPFATLKISLMVKESPSGSGQHRKSGDTINPMRWRYRKCHEMTGFPCLLLLGAPEKIQGWSPSSWRLGTDPPFAVPPLTNLGSILLDLRKRITNQNRHFLGQTDPMFVSYQ